jgi:hypothetical protein
MPTRRPGEPRSSYVGRAIPEIVHEKMAQGKSKKEAVREAVGKAEGMFDSYVHQRGQKHTARKRRTHRH